MTFLVSGKATVSTTLVQQIIKKVSNSAYSLIDSSFTVDEYNELYVTATLRQKTNNTTTDSFWVGKFDLDADLIWNAGMHHLEILMLLIQAIDILVI